MHMKKCNCICNFINFRQCNRNKKFISFLAKLFQQRCMVVCFGAPLPIRIHRRLNLRKVITAVTFTERTVFSCKYIRSVQWNSPATTGVIAIGWKCSKSHEIRDNTLNGVQLVITEADVIACFKTQHVTQQVQHEGGRDQWSGGFYRALRIFLIGVIWDGTHQNFSIAEGVWIVHALQVYSDIAFVKPMFLFRRSWQEKNWICNKKTL